MADHLSSAMFGILGLVLLGICLLILRRPRHIINTTYASSMGILSLGMFVGAFYYLEETLELAYDLSYLFVTLSPLGIYWTGRLINHGLDAWKERFVVVFSITYSLVAIGLVIVENERTYDLTTSLWFVILIVIVLVVLYEYLKIYQAIPEQRNKLIFFLTGFSIVVLGLSIDLVFFLLSGDDSQFIGTFGVIFGFLTTGVAFTNLPEKFQIGEK